MSSADTTEKLHSLLNGDGFNFRFHCGYNKPTVRISLKDKEDMIRSIWIHHVLFHPHTELDQLRKGINQTLNFELLAVIHPQEAWVLFAASTVFIATPQHLCDSFVVNYFDNGSNRRTKEEAIIMFWYEYITECARRDDVNVGEVLKFLSGSSKIPAMGFENVPGIKFMDDERLPTVSTCAMSITFPRSMGLLAYEKFKDKMDFCILGSYGFGSV